MDTTLICGPYSRFANCPNNVFTTLFLPLTRDLVPDHMESPVVTFLWCPLLWDCSLAFLYLSLHEHFIE